MPETMKDDWSLVSMTMRYMVANSERRSDGTGVFHGSPRGHMETIRVSNGTTYNRLYSLGVTREGIGAGAVWSIPKELMDRYQS